MRSHTDTVSSAVVPVSELVERRWVHRRRHLRLLLLWCSQVAKRPVSIGVDSTCLQSYHGGIINDESCYRSLDHAVLAVGYGPGYWRVRAPLISTRPAHRPQLSITPPRYTLLAHSLLYTGMAQVKNSWGGSFGESGYFRVESGKGILGIGKQGAYPTSVHTK